MKRCTVIVITFLFDFVVPENLDNTLSLLCELILPKLGDTDQETINNDSVCKNAAS